MASPALERGDGHKENVERRIKSQKEGSKYPLGFRLSD